MAHVLDVTNQNRTCVLVAASGLTLLLDYQRGLYLLVPALIAVLVGGVINAWLVLVKAALSRGGRRRIAKRLFTP